MSEQERAIPEPRIGYISVRSNQDFHWAGLLVVDADGDPIEFAQAEAVKLRPLMSTLLGNRLRSFVAARLLAPPLLSCCKVSPDLVCFEEATVLHRRLDLGIPIAVFAPVGCTVAETHWQRLEPQPGDLIQEWWGQASCWQQVQSVLQVAARCMVPGNLADPFERLDEALKEMQPRDEDMTP